MNIKINKDFDKEYKDEMYRGMTAKEVLSIAAAAAVAGAVIFLLHRYAGVPLAAGVYPGVFCAIPFLAAGFVTFQGMSPARYLKEMIYARRTRLLTYEADELPKAERSFSMEKPKQKKKRKKHAGFRHKDRRG